MIQKKIFMIFIYMYLLDPRCKHRLHALVDRDVGPTPTPAVKVWDSVHDQVMEVQGARVDLYCTRKEPRKVLYVPVNVKKVTISSYSGTNSS